MSLEFFTPDNETTKMALYGVEWWIGDDLTTSKTPSVVYDGKTTADKTKVLLTIHSVPSYYVPCV